MNEATKNTTNHPTTEQLVTSPHPADHRAAKKKLAAITEYIARLTSASLLTMWGVLNIVINLRTWLAPAPTDSVGEPVAWWIPAMFVVLTSILPLAIGLRMFYSLLRQTRSTG